MSTLMNKKILAAFLSSLLILPMSALAKPKGATLDYLCKNLPTLSYPNDFDAAIESVASNEERNGIRLYRDFVGCFILEHLPTTCNLAPPAKYSPFESSVPLILKYGGTSPELSARVLICNINFLKTNEKEKYNKCLRNVEEAEKKLKGNAETTKV